MRFGAILISARGGGLKDPPPVGHRVKFLLLLFPPIFLSLSTLLHGANPVLFALPNWGAIVTRTYVACANVSVAVVPRSYFGVPNFIPIVTFLLKKVRWGFLVDVVLLMG